MSCILWPHGVPSSTRGTCSQSRYLRVAAQEEGRESGRMWGRRKRESETESGEPVNAIQHKAEGALRVCALVSYHICRSYRRAQCSIMGHMDTWGDISFNSHHSVVLYYTMFVYTTLALAMSCLENYETALLVQVAAIRKDAEADSETDSESERAVENLQRM